MLYIVYILIGGIVNFLDLFLLKKTIVYVAEKKKSFVFFISFLIRMLLIVFILIILHRLFLNNWKSVFLCFLLGFSIARFLYILLKKLQKI